MNIVTFTTETLGLKVSPAQETLLRSIYGLPLDAEQLAIWQTCTGRETYPERRFSEATILAGARAGKDSRIAGPIVCFEALFGEHETRVTKGEQAVIPIVAQDQRATRIAFGYVRDYLSSPEIAGCVVNERQNEIELMNGLSIIAFPCTLRSLRGWSIPCGVLDELAFFRLEGQVDSDVEVQASIRRGGISFPMTTLVKISTPYMKSGVLYDDFQKAFGKDDPDLLVWRASSALMNPTLTPERLAKEKRLDPSRYAREYEAEFTDDLSAFLPTAWVQAAVKAGRFELPPRAGVTYVAACDPSGGGPDAFTFTIVHRDGERVVQDVLKGYKRVAGQSPNLSAVVREIAEYLRAYRIREIYGDRFTGNWARQEFQKAGIAYNHLEVERNGKTVYVDRSTAYGEVGPLFAQGLIELLDHPEQQREFQLLERRARPGGNDLIDHPRGGHDDHANSFALAATKVISRASGTQYRIRSGYALLHEPNPAEVERLRVAREQGIKLFTEELRKEDGHMPSEDWIRRGAREDFD